MDRENTITQLAKRFGVSETTIRNWTYDGLKTKTKKVIGKRKFKIVMESDLQEYLLKNKIEQ